ncbi:MAG: TrkA family potassium uptake protein [Candidatus Marinimicrobia bacterium]|nr:TrkA family potassium uptake protein [Candidatus Neomarinimicrobiota bacterium]
MKQFVVIGLGTFGYNLATGLYEKGYEVLVIDHNADLVQAIKDKVSRAVVADASQKNILESLGVKDVDSTIVCIGSSIETSVLSTLNLKDIGVKHVIAKATSKTHSRLLYKVGASEVFFPERDQAVTLAERLQNPNIMGYLPFVEGYSIIEFAPIKKFIGKSLKDLDLINRFGIQVLAIKEIITNKFTMVPTAQYIVKDSDILILLGQKDAFAKL